MNTKQPSSFFAGFVMGALAGGSVALLLAPQSGEETRTQMRRQVVELKNKGQKTYDEALKRVEASKEQVQQKIDEITAAVDETQHRRTSPNIKLHFRRSTR